MGDLYIVPTPIGNLEDITYRAVKLFKKADIIFSEDTRVTKLLLNKLSITYTAKIFSYNKDNEHKKTDTFYTMILKNNCCLLVTDAGTPVISDPGYLLIKKCLENNLKIISVPGANAITTALVATGLPCDQFIFYGFIPHKKKRQSFFKEIMSSNKTSIMYESPHRIQKTIEQLYEILTTDRKIVIARELTKLYETYIRGTIEEIFQKRNKLVLKGEIVLIISKPLN